MSARGQHCEKKTRARWAAAGLLALWCLAVTSVQAEDLAAPQPAPVQPGAWQERTRTQAQVMPGRAASLRAPFPVMVQSWQVEPGQSVRQGQELARLEAPGLRALLMQVQAASEQARQVQALLDNARWRWQNKLATEDERLRAESGLAQAKLGLENAWSALQSALLSLGQTPTRQAVLASLGQDSPEAVAKRWSRLCAPWAGVVAARAAGAGGWVESSQPLAVMHDMAQVRLEAAVPPEDLAAWRGGSCLVQEPRSQGVAVRLLTQTPALDPASGLARLEFSAVNPQSRWLEGTWLRLEARGPERPVFWVPAPAVVAREGKTFCLRRQGQDYAPVEVRVGAEEEGRIPVLAGLAAGDEVATRGAYLLLYRDLKQIIELDD